LEEEHIRITAQSSLYATEPRDVRCQPWFLNMAVGCETDCFPMQLLAVTRKIERELGRKHGPAARAKGPRTIDIDILLFGDRTVETPSLVIPHPRMLERRFVLQPLLEIAPDLRHPRTRQPLRDYLPAVSSQHVRKVNSSTRYLSENDIVV
jgi:2-amino-4-hydroxy-6-hydroxymethyldihydropteridine diphosphokinase